MVNHYYWTLTLKLDKLLTMTPIMIKVRMVNISPHDVDALSVFYPEESKQAIERDNAGYSECPWYCL